MQKSLIKNAQIHFLAFIVAPAIEWYEIVTLDEEWKQIAYNNFPTFIKDALEKIIE